MRVAAQAQAGEDGKAGQELLFRVPVVRKPAPEFLPPRRQAARRGIGAGAAEGDDRVHRDAHDRSGGRVWAEEMSWGLGTVRRQF